MRVNQDGPGWHRYDPETIGNTRGGVAHLASAGQNLRAVGEDTLRAVAIDHTVRELVTASEHGFFPALLGLMGGLFLDVFELIALPFMWVKNLSDAGAHVVAGVADQAAGEADGVARDEHRYPFDPERGTSSVFRQLEPVDLERLRPPCRGGVRLSGG